MSNLWEVFYAPHTDDESIGMAGAISRAVLAGRSVLVCLVTDNRPSVRGMRLFPDLDLIKERRNEWHRALDALKVTERATWEIPESVMPRMFASTRDEIRRRMVELHQSRDVVHHHTTWGMWDQNDGIHSIAHELCASAAYELSFMNARVSLYGIYEYAKQVHFRTAPVIETLSLVERARKIEALSMYQRGEGTIGYGFASVPELITAARIDPREFVIRL